MIIIMIIIKGKKLMDVLKALVYELFLETFYETFLKREKSIWIYIYIYIYIYYIFLYSP